MLMREIKFKAWDAKDEVFYVTIDIAELATGVSKMLEYHDVLKKRYKDVTWLQYTGLKDKNDKDIYEGDIVAQDKYAHFPQFNTVVEFRDGCFFPFNGGDCGDCSNEGSWLRDEPDYQVIGNIHENKDLL